MISVLIYRAFHICSSYKNFHDEIVRIKEILSKNSFLRALTDRIIKSFLDKRFAPRAPALAEVKTALLFCIPYLGRYSLQMKTRICRLLKQCYPGIQLQVIFRSSKRIQSFFPFKDRFPALIRSSVVYQFKCPGCHALYFGKTTRHLITRCREHLAITRQVRKLKLVPQPSGTILTNQVTLRRWKIFQFWTELTMILICSFMKVY